MNTEIKELKLEFNGKGRVSDRVFRQISSSENAYLYEVTSSGSKYYEIFKKRLNDRFSTISYPSDKAFGLWAWTTSSLKKAEDIFDKLNSVTK